jgi:hypothetical protein
MSVLEVSALVFTFALVSLGIWLLRRDFHAFDRLGGPAETGLFVGKSSIGTDRDRGGGYVHWRPSFMGRAWSSLTCSERAQILADYGLDTPGLEQEKWNMNAEKKGSRDLLDQAMKALHDIAGAYAARKMLARKLAPELRRRLEAKALSDEEIEKLALDVWEEIAKELIE